MSQSLYTTLADLVSINSVNAFYDHGPGEAELSRYVENFFYREKIASKRQSVLAATETVSARENIIATLPGKHSNRTLVLEAHMDTVSVDGMTIEPWNPKINCGRMFGRGSVDTKAGLAAMMLAMADLKRQGLTPACNVCLAAVVDEEHSFLGVTEFLKTEKPDAAVVAEPTNLKIVVASKGVLRWRIIARGKAAHSSKVHLGVNAIQHMARILVEIESHHDGLSRRPSHPLLGPASGNVGTIRGGVQINFVPHECAIEIDRRLLPNDSVSEVLGEYQSIIDRCLQTDPAMSVVMEPPMLVDPAFETSQNVPLVTAAKQVSQQLGLDCDGYGVPFGSDASKFARAGVPCILFGPGSIDQAHTADEYVELQQVEQAFEFFRKILLEYEG